MRAEITDFYHGEKTSESYGGEIVFRAKEIVVSWTQSSPTHRTMIWRGDEVGEGHWKLTCPDFKGKASLHRSPYDPNCLEGSFLQEGWDGMWKIDIEDEE